MNWAQLLDGRPVILLAADPGAAAQLEALAPALAEAGLVVHWCREGWAAAHREPTAPLDDLLTAGSMVVVGARMDFERCRQVFLQAHRAGARSAYLFDHWKNYAQPFLGPDGETAILPDLILVPDDAAGRAVDSLVPGAGSRLRVVGHPAVEAATARLTAIDAEQRAEAALRWNPERRRLALLMLDPPPPPELDPGYGPAEVLAFLPTWIARHRPDWRVLIKAHPRQPPDTLESALAGWIGIDHASVDGDYLPYMTIADEVWGMTTISLVTALKAGLPIISFQPGRTMRGREQSNAVIEPFVVTDY